jgi:hypothetical protein
MKVRETVARAVTLRVAWCVNLERRSIVAIGDRLSVLPGLRNGAPRPVSAEGRPADTVDAVVLAEESFGRR